MACASQRAHTLCQHHDREKPTARHATITSGMQDSKQDVRRHRRMDGQTERQTGKQPSRKATRRQTLTSGR